MTITAVIIIIVEVNIGLVHAPDLEHGDLGLRLDVGPLVLEVGEIGRVEDIIIAAAVAIIIIIGGEVSCWVGGGYECGE